MGVITSNRGASRGGISSNICEIPLRQYFGDGYSFTISGVFVANNICGQIEKNILTQYGITNNSATSIRFNHTGKINNNNCNNIISNSVAKEISYNNTESNIAFNIITGGEIVDNTLNMISGNIANSISSNISLGSNIEGNFIKGIISNNNLQYGNIKENYTGDIINNY